MALTPSSMLSLGTDAPVFELPDVVSGNKISIEEVKGENGLVVMFICNHCPYVMYVQDEIARLADEYLQKGIGFVAISSNNVEKYPDDSPDHMKQQAKKMRFHFPYLYDESQSVAKAYQAECTPDFFLFDNNLDLVYRGRLDEATPGNGKPVNGKDLRSAMDNLIDGNPISEVQFPSIGCNIKWK